MSGREPTDMNALIRSKAGHQRSYAQASPAESDASSEASDRSPSEAATPVHHDVAGLSSGAPNIAAGPPPEYRSGPEMINDHLRDVVAEKRLGRRSGWR